MPNQTFWNLPEAKRQALIQIATEEFANNDYDTASISRIVTRAGIAKGSIYQYFEDKKELFLYLLTLSNQKRLEYIQQEASDEPPIAFWALLRWQIRATTRAAIAYPMLTKLFYRAMAANLPFRDEMVHGMKNMALDYWHQTLRRAISSGDVRPNIDLDLAAVLLNAVFTEVGLHVMARFGLETEQLHTLDVSRFETPEVESIFDSTIDLLEHGLGTRG